MRCLNGFARLILAVGLLAACSSNESVQVDVTGSDLSAPNPDGTEQDVGTDTFLVNDTLNDASDSSSLGDLPLLDSVEELVAPDVTPEDVAPADLGPPPLPAAPDWFHQTKLESVMTDDDGESEQLLVELPEDTTSVFLQVESQEDYAFYTLKTVVTPKPLNQIIVKGAGDATCIPCINRVSAAQKVASFLMPNDPQIEVKGGKWLFRLRATGVLKTAGDVVSYPPVSSTADVTILARTQPIPDKGVLRLHMHFTGAGDLTAENAPDNERLAAGIAAASEIMAAAGIELVVAGYHDVPGVEEDPSLLALESTIGNPNDLSKLLLLGQPEDLSALNLFFVDSIYKDGDFAGGGLVLGIAAGIPGPAFLGPSYRSGVVIALFEKGEGTDYLGNVIAHEVGHYLGLYHTTESIGNLHDTLLDTAEGDKDNLMFWAYSDSQKQLSDGQGTVIRSHPLVLPMGDEKPESPQDPEGP